MRPFVDTLQTDVLMWSFPSNPVREVMDRYDNDRYDNKPDMGKSFLPPVGSAPDNAPKVSSVISRDGPVLRTLGPHPPIPPSCDTCDAFPAAGPLQAGLQRASQHARIARSPEGSARARCTAHPGSSGANPPGRPHQRAAGSSAATRRTSPRSSGCPTAPGAESIRAWLVWGRCRARSADRLAGPLRRSRLRAAWPRFALIPPSPCCVCSVRRRRSFTRPAAYQ